MTASFHHRRRPAFNARTPNNPSRRAFLSYGGAVVDGALVGACGGGSDDAVAPVATTPTAPVQADPIWSPGGLATTIISSLKSVAWNALPAVDFQVKAYGAQPCSVVAQTSPYTDPTKSPVSSGASATQAPGAFDPHPAFLAAIVACSTAGGGCVMVSSSTWYCVGSIALQSNVNFHPSANCMIYFSVNPADYAKDGPIDRGTNGKLFYSRWQADDCLNYGSPTYARNASNIALAGEGVTSVLNGQAMTPFAGTGNTDTCWWTSKDTNGAYGYASSSTPSQTYNSPNNVDLQTATPGIPSALYARLTNPATPWQQDQNYLPALSEAGVPVGKRIFGLGHYLRPCMVELIGCTNVLVENYRTVNTPLWQHHPVHCTNVVIRDVTVDSIGLSNDGFDPDACSNVLCEDVTFNTGDDYIAIKSGKNLDTGYGPAQDHVIQNCTMNSGHGGTTLGSEMGGGVQNTYARNLAMPNQFRATNPLNIAIRIETNMNCGGFIKNFYVTNVSLPNGVNLTGAGYGSKMLAGSPINGTVPLSVVTPNVTNPPASQGGIITFDCDYQPVADTIHTRPALVRNVNISNVTAGSVTINGLTGSCFQAAVAQGPVAFDYNDPLPVPAIPPIAGVTISNCNFGTPTATGPASATTSGSLYAYNVHDITLQNVVIAGQTFNITVTDAH